MTTKILAFIGEFISNAKRLNFVLIILLGLSLLFSIRQCNIKNDYQAKYENTTKEIKTSTTVLERYTDSANRNHLIVEDNVLSPKQAKEQLAVSGGLIDTVAQALKIAKEKITELTRVNAYLSAENLKASNTRVNNNGKIVNVWKYKDKYADLSFNEADTTFGFKYNLDLKTAGYRDKAWFLAQPVDVLELYSEDPRVTINSVERFKVRTPDPTFGAKIKAKALYNPKEKEVLAGTALDLSIGRLTLEANYLYNTGENKWVPLVGAKWDVYIAK